MHITTDAPWEGVQQCHSGASCRWWADGAQGRHNSHLDRRPRLGQVVTSWAAVHAFDMMDSTSAIIFGSALFMSKSISPDDFAAAFDTSPEPVQVQRHAQQSVREPPGTEQSRGGAASPAAPSAGWRAGWCAARRASAAVVCPPLPQTRCRPMWRRRCAHALGSGQWALPGTRSPQPHPTCRDGILKNMGPRDRT